MSAAPADRSPAAGPQRSAIETTALIGVSAGLILAAVPLVGQAPPWTLALFAIAIGIRLRVNLKSYRLPTIGFKIVLLGAGLLGISLQFRAVIGIEPGLGILLLLLSLKLLETNSPRDFHVLSVLGWFLSLCALFFAQDLARCIYIGIVCALLTASVVRFHRGPGPSSFGRSLRLAAVLLLQAIPLVVVLFFFFPRAYGGFRFNFSRTAMSTSGMSDRMEPGSVATLALSDAPAFRVEFPDQSFPPVADLYWRGAILWHGDGLRWEKLPMNQNEPALPMKIGTGIRQRIVLEPHGARWIFALDQPVIPGPNMTLEAGNYLQSIRPVVNPLKYDVTSFRVLKPMQLLPSHRTQALQKPTQISPKIQRLVASWRTGASDDRAVVDRAFAYFGTGKFIYTLEPGTQESLDEFLFERRSGFCEHYASAFATLMRIAEIPSRVVIGYHGGEFNGLGNYGIVRQSDAHAWCEVWLPNTGWTRIDPVDAIAPDRIQDGLTAFLDSQSGDSSLDAGSGRRSASGFRRMSRQFRLAWDGINFQWGLRVMNFDETTQRSFFASIGLGTSPWPRVIAWSVAGCALFLGALLIYLRHSHRPREDAVVRGYHRFCQRLAHAGLPRAPHEGPLKYIERAASSFPQQAEIIRKIGVLYIGLRYTQSPPSLDEFSGEVRSFQKIKLPQSGN